MFNNFYFPYYLKESLPHLSGECSDRPLTAEASAEAQESVRGGFDTNSESDKNFPAVFNAFLHFSNCI